MTDECIILTENGIQKANSLHRVTPEEKFLVSELEKARDFSSNDVAENMKSAIETRQDQARSSMISPMVESFGSTVLLYAAPSSKDEATSCSLHVIDGINVVTALVPEEDVWQIEETKTCAREIQFQDGEQESVAIEDREDPIVSKTINVCETRTGETRLRRNAEKKSQRGARV